MSKSVAVPPKMLAWRLYGAGMENFGDLEQPVEIPVPEISDDELLVRIDAVGLCFSDVKLIRAGVEHPRVISQDLKTDPVIPGHEAVMTVVKVGAALASRFRVGERFIIQADIYVNGKGFAYGYAINGGMAQYSVLDSRVLNGDEGCYLLPLDPATPTAVAALMEPWTCVQASYMIENRTAPKKGGVAFAVFGGQATDYSAGEAACRAQWEKLVVMNAPLAVLAKLRSELGIPVEAVNALPAAGEFDDIFICDVADRALAEAAAKLGKRGAVTSFIGAYPDEEWSFDVGSIHYEGWFYQGTSSHDWSQAYNRNVRSREKKGGVCWLPGGAGAMGQMHTQMAVESADGPSRILVSDLDPVRIANVKRLLKDAIEARKIEFKTLNPGEMTPEEFDRAVTEFAPEGFDDIIMLVPVVPILNQAARHLAQDGLMNIFAGIPAGKEALLNVRQIAADGVRYIGSSGSKTAHLRHTLELAESGKLQPVTALAAVGGMKELKHGLEAVINAAFPGKTVIFPNCPDMPLTPVSQLEKIDPALKATLDATGLYTMATEEALLTRYEV